MMDFIKKLIVTAVSIGVGIGTGIALEFGISIGLSKMLNIENPLGIEVYTF